jgi:hypothetical protein
MYHKFTCTKFINKYTSAHTYAHLIQTQTHYNIYIHASTQIINIHEYIHTHQTDVARQSDEKLSSTVTAFERERLILAEELEAVKGSLGEEKEAAERVRYELDRAKRERQEALKEATAERERVEMLRKELKSVSVCVCVCVSE